MVALINHLPTYLLTYLKYDLVTVLTQIRRGRFHLVCYNVECTTTVIELKVH